MFGLTLSFLELKLIQVVQASACPTHINVVCGDARLLEELHILMLLVRQCDRELQREVDDGQQLVGCARLEECMLDLSERDIELQTFRAHVADSILVQLQVADGLLAFEVWLDRHVLEHVTAAGNRFKGLHLLHVSLVLLPFIFLGISLLDLFDQIFDLLVHDSKMVRFTALVLVLKGQFLKEHNIWIVFEVRE